MQQNISKPKYLILLAALYITVILLTMIVENRVINIGSLRIVSGTLVLPFAYTISDIITEVYGYKEMRSLIWTSIFILYFVAFVFYILMKLPSPSEAVNVNHAYQIVLQPFMRNIFTYSLAAILGVFLNAFILSKWKLLVHGKIFWFRSLGSSAVGELIFVIVFGFIAFYGVFPAEEIAGILIFSYIYKIICNLISIVPAAIIVSILKKSEKIDTYDFGINFNPFEVTL